MAWWPFNRRRKAAPGVETLPASHGDSLETWAVGDLAECIEAGPWLSFLGERREGPQKGDVHFVTRVELQFDEQFLGFGHRFKFYVYECKRFRKITPRADTAEAADADFINSLTKVQS